MRDPFRSTNWAGSKMQLPFMPKFASCPRREWSRWEASDMDDARRVSERVRASQSNLRFALPLGWRTFSQPVSMSPAGMERAGAGDIDEAPKGRARGRERINRTFALNYH